MCGDIARISQLTHPTHCVRISPHLIPCEWCALCTPVQVEPPQHVRRERTSHGCHQRRRRRSVIGGDVCADPCANWLMSFHSCFSTPSKIVQVICHASLNTVSSFILIFNIEKLKPSLLIGRGCNKASSEMVEPCWITKGLDQPAKKDRKVMHGWTQKMASSLGSD